tara:strand:+ start:368 stop:910 length:543 start_codon:yes stop_codon:yes gene_type:complete
MRIIAGIYKNRRIDFKNLNIRPTTNFAKESLFNILNNHYDLETKSVLDLFAGSGSISYEFASRGCKEIIAVDNNIKCVNFINNIKDKLTITNLITKSANVTAFLKHIDTSHDIIFLDPPYNYKQEQYDQIVTNILKKNILNKYGMIIIEHSRFIKFDNYPSFFNVKKYGRVHFTFLKNEK